MSFRFAKAAVVGAALATAGFGASAAHAADATAEARARVLTQVTIARTAHLDFGSLVADADGGSVVLTAAGGRTCTGLTCAGTPVAGAFNVTGTAGQVVVVSTPAAITLAGPTGSTPMPVSFTTGNATLTLAAGANALTVGGTLTVNANQAEGSYVGTFTQTVNYQ